MDELEAKAFKIVLMWQDLCKKEFPNERHVKISKDKDPRKSTLFKYCYKLAKETKGLLSNDKEYYIYILAQLQMLKLMKEGNIHALIEPQILVGEKAWKRWKIWKRKYDKKLKEFKTSKELGLITDPELIKIELIKTQKFMKSKNYSEITKEQINRWFKNGTISAYYVCLSDFAQKFVEDFDFDLYKPSITPEIEEFYKKEFAYEL